MFRLTALAVGASALRMRGVAEVQKNLIAGAEAFNAATEAMTYSPEQAEVTAALQSATIGSGMGSSTGAASFVQTPSKISMEQLSNIAAAVEASAAKHVASGRASKNCGSCTPDFSSCPSGFVSTGGSCAPSADYAGYCNKNFAPGEYSPVELEEFEVFCDVCFPCSRASFLGADKDNLVKDGLFVTQPLRSDSAVKVNVIEREPAFGASAQTLATASSAAHMRAQFDADLAKLRSSFMQQRFSDILTRNAGAPTEVIDFSIESGVPDAISARKAAEVKRSESAAAADLNRRRIAAETALDSLLATENHHAAAMSDLLG